MPELYKLISVLLTAGFKYVVAVMMAFGMGLGFIWSVIACTVGGMLGVAVYTLAEEFLRKRIMAVRRKKGKKMFKVNRTSRLIITIKHHHGLLGIAVLTPVLLTVPVGTIAGLALGYHWRELFTYMFFSFLGWSLFFFGIYALTGWNLNEWLTGIF